MRVRQFRLRGKVAWTVSEVTVNIIIINNIYTELVTRVLDTVSRSIIFKSKLEPYEITKS